MRLARRHGDERHGRVDRLLALIGGARAIRIMAIRTRRPSVSPMSQHGHSTRCPHLRTLAYDGRTLCRTLPLAFISIDLTARRPLVTTLAPPPEMLAPIRADAGGHRDQLGKMSRKCSMIHIATIRRAGYTESAFIEYSDVPLGRVTKNPSDYLPRICAAIPTGSIDDRRSVDWRIERMTIISRSQREVIRGAWSMDAFATDLPESRRIRCQILSIHCSWMPVYIRLEKPQIGSRICVRVRRRNNPHAGVKTASSGSIGHDSGLW
jgi:hypothetical protein